MLILFFNTAVASPDKLFLDFVNYSASIDGYSSLCIKNYDDEKEILYSFNRIHIAIATNTHLGLIVPVVRDVQSMNIWQCARELRAITAATKTGKAQPQQIKGSTMTISSLGLLGGVSSSPIVNHPEVAIISPNRLRELPVVKDGQIAIRKMMNISASFDHRIVDGYEAARFIQSLKQILESPKELVLT